MFFIYLCRMPHQKLLLIMIRVWLITTITTLWWNFPLQEVAQPACRWIARDELWADCKVDIIAWSHQKDIGKLLFSALRGTSYETPLNPKSGWHPSLDLPTSAWTPVYAIHDGVVVNASERAGYGLSITIKHTMDNTVIFSNYSHLSEMLVKKGDKVGGNSVIWKVGCTGFSISGDPTRCWNHLDFQLTTDKSPSHPYGYGDCAAGYMDAVQQWSCAEKLRAYTIDPLVFFATNTNINLNYPLIAPHIVSSSSNKPPKEESNHTAAPETTLVSSKPKPSLQSIFARLREQNSRILDKKTENSATNSQTTSNAATVSSKPTTQQPTPTWVAWVNHATIDIGTISREWNDNLSNLTTYKVVTATFTITDKLWNPFIGTLPQAVRLRIDNTDIGSFFPDQFTLINIDKKHLFFQTRTVWTAKLSIRYGETKIGETTVTVN